MFITLLCCTNFEAYCIPERKTHSVTPNLGTTRSSRVRILPKAEDKVGNIGLLSLAGTSLGLAAYFREG
jgi:hypothetical protein